MSVVVDVHGVMKTAGPSLDHDPDFLKKVQREKKIHFGNRG
jgi:hypothetical protein